MKKLLGGGKKKKPNKDASFSDVPDFDGDADVEFSKSGSALSESPASSPRSSFDSAVREKPAADLSPALLPPLGRKVSSSVSSVPAVRKRENNRQICLPPSLYIYTFLDLFLCIFLCIFSLSHCL